MEKRHALQDLDGFDAEMSLKAIHPSPARPQAAAAAGIGQSASLPLLPRRAELQGGRAPSAVHQGTPSKARAFGRSVSHAAGEGAATPAAAGDRGRGYGRSITFAAGAAAGEDGAAVLQPQGAAPEKAARKGSGQLTSVHVSHLGLSPRAISFLRGLEEMCLYVHVPMKCFWPRHSLDPHADVACLLGQADAAFTGFQTISLEVGGPRLYYSAAHTLAHMHSSSSMCEFTVLCCASSTHDQRTHGACRLRMCQCVATSPRERLSPCMNHG